MRRPDRVNAHSRQADEPEAESLAEWVKATKGKHYEQYCNEMEKNRTWGDDVTLVAICNEFRVRILLWSSTASESNYYSEHLPRAPAAARAERTIWLCHVLECHYGSVHPIVDDDGESTKESARLQALAAEFRVVSLKTSQDIPDSLQLVNERLEVVDKTVKWLATLGAREVSAVGIAGAARTGKSYLLSRLANATNAFRVAHEQTASTRGVWVGTAALERRGSNALVLLLDFEGVQHTDGTASTDECVLKLAALLCEVLIYNCGAVPSASDMSELMAFVKATQNLVVASGIRERLSPEAASQLARSQMPHVIWLCRNHSLLKPENITSLREWMRSLQTRSSVEEPSDADVAKLRVEKMFRQPMLVCALPAPGVGAVLGRLERTEPAQLEREFEESLQQLRERIYALLPADGGGRLCGKRGPSGARLTGALFADLARRWTNAVRNSELAPTATTWERALLAALDSALDAAAKAYNDEMTAALRNARVLTVASDGSSVVQTEPLDVAARQASPLPLLSELHYAAQSKAVQRALAGVPSLTADETALVRSLARLSCARFANEPTREAVRAALSAALESLGAASGGELVADRAATPSAEPVDGWYRAIYERNARCSDSVLQLRLGALEASLAGDTAVRDAESARAACERALAAVRSSVRGPMVDVRCDAWLRDAMPPLVSRLAAQAEARDAPAREAERARKQATEQEAELRRVRAEADARRAEAQREDKRAELVAIPRVMGEVAARAAVREQRRTAVKHVGKLLSEHVARRRAQHAASASELAATKAQVDAQLDILRRRGGNAPAAAALSAAVPAGPEVGALWLADFADAAVRADIEEQLDDAASLRAPGSACVNIVVLGARAVGKTSVIAAITDACGGSTPAVPLDEPTMGVQAYTLRVPGAAGNTVRLWDTTGYDATLGHTWNYVEHLLSGMVAENVRTQQVPSTSLVRGNVADGIVVVVDGNSALSEASRLCIEFARTVAQRKSLRLCAVVSKLDALCGGDVRSARTSDRVRASLELLAASAGLELCAVAPVCGAAAARGDATARAMALAALLNLVEYANEGMSARLAVRQTKLIAETTTAKAK